MEGHRLPCKLKIVCGEEIYKVTVECYNELNAYISKNVLGDTFRGTPKLTYVDSDGDVVVIKCEKDFEEAAGENAGKVLKLTVEKSPNTPFSSSVLLNDDDPTIVEVEECTNVERPSLEPPVAKKGKFDLSRLETVCRELSSQHEKIYGVGCHFQASEKNGDVFVHCPFCKTDIKPQKGKTVCSLQPYIEHMKRNSHRSNVLSVCNRDALTSEKFGDLQLKEITARRFLEATAPGVFDVKKSKDDGSTLVAVCTVCGTSTFFKLFPKSSSLEASVTSHLNGRQHAAAKKGGIQSRITSFVSLSGPRGDAGSSTSSSHT